MNEKKEGGIDESRDEEDSQKNQRISDPGRTPGQAEGTVDEVNEALRRERERRRHEH